MPCAKRRARADPVLRAVLRETQRRLEAARLAFGHGTTNARDEAAWLVLHALELPFEALASHLERAVSEDEARRVSALVEARIRTREPAAYLTREAWLGEHRFYVDRRVIVPRSYIAELLRENLAPWVGAPDGVRRALDLCTGSGCLAILLALAFARASIDAADLSSDALDVARRNVADYGLGRRVKLYRSDLYAALGARRYSLIVTNPPYVSDAAMRALPPEYRKEPALALAGGRDGLDVVRRILAGAARHLTPGGVLVCEVGHHRSRVERAFPGMPFVWPQTSGGDDCVFVLTREALLASQARSSPATPRAASPPQRAKRSPARASGAAAGRRRRNARASTGSR